MENKAPITRNQPISGYLRDGNRICDDKRQIHKYIHSKHNHWTPSKSVYLRSFNKIEIASTRILVNHVLCYQIPKHETYTKSNEISGNKFCYWCSANNWKHKFLSTTVPWNPSFLRLYFTFPAEEQHIDKFYYNSKLCAFHHLQILNSSRKLTTKTIKQNAIIWADQQ